jgi:myo-inositol-1(or 4)-monophosphatase
MNPADLAMRLRAAEAIAREAGRQAAEFYRRRDRLDIERKGLQDLVSEADRACETAIVEALHRLFPDDSFLGEEHGLQVPGGGATWVIDPIDGTYNFLRGIPVWCVSIGLIAGNRSIAGVIYNPITEELYSAQDGAGARLNGKPIAVSGARILREARLCVGFSYRRPVAPHVEGVRRLLEAHCEYARFGSGALGLAMTADGRFDGYWEAHINLWDVAAGLCLIREAGGCNNDFITPDAFAKGNFILAATPDLMPELQQLLDVEPAAA